MAYRVLHRKTWVDERFRLLDPEGKLLALYLICGPQTNRLGIFTFSLGLASEHTGIDRYRIDTVYDTVCDTLSWVRDPTTDTVYLPNWWRHNPPPNERAFKGALKDLDDLPRTVLLSRWLLTTKELCKYDEILDTVCHTVCHTLSIPYTAQEQEQEQEQDQEHLTPQSPPRGAEQPGLFIDEKDTSEEQPPTGKTKHSYTEIFERFWSVYECPRKGSKWRAFGAWRRHVINAGFDPELVIRRATEYAASDRGRGEYSQQASTWLNGRCWEDEDSSWSDQTPRTEWTAEDFA